MSFKNEVYEQCKQAIAEKLSMHQQTLHELIESAADETKSSAGDKYETSLAMLQIEQDNVRRQIAEVMTMKTMLDVIDPAIGSEVINTGSLIRSGNDYYFISTGLGKIMVNEKRVIAISPQSPLGGKLMGLAAGEAVEMNGKQIAVDEVM